MGEVRLDWVQFCKEIKNRTNDVMNSKLEGHKSESEKS